MNRIFKAGQMFPIPDGTLVSPFLNPLDANQSDLPSELLSGMSIAAGLINPGVQSKIQIHPFVSLVTWVVDGDLEVRMKGPRDTAPYSISVRPQQAVLTEAHSFFQLINASTSAVVRKKHEGLLNTDEWLIAWFLLEKAHPLVLHCIVNMSI